MTKPKVGWKTTKFWLSTIAVLTLVILFLGGCQWATMKETYKAPSQQVTPRREYESTQGDLSEFIEILARAIEPKRIPVTNSPTAVSLPTVTTQPERRYTYAKACTAKGCVLVRIYDDPNGTRFVQPVEPITGESK